MTEVPQRRSFQSYLPTIGMTTCVALFVLYANTVTYQVEIARGSKHTVVADVRGWPMYFFYCDGVRPVVRLSDGGPYEATLGENLVYKRHPLLWDEWIAVSGNVIFNLSLLLMVAGIFEFFRWVTRLFQEPVR